MAIESDELTVQLTMVWVEQKRIVGDDMQELDDFIALLMSPSQ